MYILMGGLVALAVALTLAHFLPRFSAYFLGPALLVMGALTFISLNKYFFPFQSDGSIAGLITCALMGSVMIGLGRSRIKQRSLEATRPPYE